MVIDSRPVALVYRLLAVVLIATGIIWLGGMFSGDPSWTAFLFFTGMSNVLCLLWMALLVVATTHDLTTSGPQGVSAPAPRFSAAVMMTITVTMLIYVVLLAPTAFEQSGSGYQPFGLTDSLVHVVTPCLVIGDWLLFTPKSRLRGWDPLLWTIPPCAYLVFVFAYVSTGGAFGDGTNRYPYPFLDVDTHGVGGVALWILALSVVLVAVGYLYLALDRVLGGLARRGGPTTVEADLVSPGRPGQA